VRFIANTQGKGVKIAFFSTVPESVAAQGIRGITALRRVWAAAQERRGSGIPRKMGFPESRRLLGAEPQGFP
jgi:hypothetical protein